MEAALRSSAWETLQSEFIQLYRTNADAIRAELSEGLLASNAYASPKYLYDVLGSKLFEAICELPEYYPTRTEAEIFSEHLFAITRSIGRGATLIDLGAGNCAKAARLFSSLQPLQYVPVDISVDFMKEAVERLQRRFPHVKMTAVGMDFSSELELPEEVRRQKRLFFYPGSSIGNFTPEQAAGFIGRVRDACHPDGGLLLGVDLVKETEILNAAYDDALGLTGAFNLNLLNHLNKLLGANFDARDWRHRSFFNEEKSRIEMYLEATRNVDVAWPDGERRFWQGQRIHTENSYKYTQENVMQLLERAGFGETRRWTDARGWFMVCHARAV